MLNLKVAWVLLAPILASAAAVNKQTKVQDCLTAAGIPGPANLTFTIKPFNLRLPFAPAAVAVPTTLAQVQAAVKCGVQAGLKINPKSGGHSYAAHSLGGEDGHFMIDLKFWNSVVVDNVTQIATVGPAGRLGNIAQSLYSQGKRAFSHGTCPG
jgi:FAD/FMN-containing dehydrogenase